MSFLSIKKILIAEDDYDLSDSYSYWFRKIDTEIVRAYDGKGVLEIMENDKDIDLLILDYRLPFYDGIEIVTYMKKNQIKIPTLLVSGYPEDFLKYIKFYASIENKEVEEVLDDLKIRIVSKPIFSEKDILEQIVNLFHNFNPSKIIKTINNIKRDLKETKQIYSVKFK